MKILKTIILILTTSVGFCQTGNKKVDLASSQNEASISRLIEYRVMIKGISDTVDYYSLKRNYMETTPKYYNKQKDSVSLAVDKITFKLYINTLKKYFNDKNAVAFNGGKKVSTSELKKVMILCDTISYMDNDKNGVYKEFKVFGCDSTTMFANIKSIRFIETWTLDKQSYEFKKEVLAFTFEGLKPGIEEFGLYPFITIYKDEKSLMTIQELSR